MSVVVRQAVLIMSIISKARYLQGVLKYDKQYLLSVLLLRQEVFTITITCKVCGNFNV